MCSYCGRILKIEFSRSNFVFEVPPKIVDKIPESTYVLIAALRVATMTAYSCWKARRLRPPSLEKYPKKSQKYILTKNMGFLEDVNFCLGDK